MTIPMPSGDALGLISSIYMLAIDNGLTTFPMPANTNILQDSSKSWASDIHHNRLVRVLSNQGKSYSAVISGNSADALTIRGFWPDTINAGAKYIILNADFIQMLRDVIGGGADISATNPLPVDTSPGVKTATTILNEAIIAAGTTTLIGDCISIDLSGGPPTLALTVEATYDIAAVLGIRIHVWTSYNDADWDTEDWDVWNPAFIAGAPIRQTRHYDTSPMYVRVLVENLDPAEDVTDVAVITTVGA